MLTNTKTIRILVLWLVIGASILPPFRPAFAEPESAFLPTWKLMKFEEKQQFVSGYIQGWIDAAHVTDIAISYVKENPSQAVEGLQSIRKLYDLTAIKPRPLVEEIDTFFSKPANSSASLSAAVTAARSTVLSKQLSNAKEDVNPLAK